MGVFERFLSAWVALAIIAGTALGSFFPSVFEWLSAFEFAQVNLIIAVLIWLMIYPVMVQVNFGAITQIAKEPKGLILTVVINWLVKPFTMALVGWLFFKGIFADFIEPETANEYLAGVILLGVAPCTAMVFIWSQLTKGDANYTLVQVSVNDIIMIFAFAPIAALLLGVTDIIVPWQTLVNCGPASDCSAVIWFSSQSFAEPAAGYSHDCYAIIGTDVRHFCYYLYYCVTH